MCTRENFAHCHEKNDCMCLCAITNTVSSTQECTYVLLDADIKMATVQYRIFRGTEPPGYDT